MVEALKWFIESAQRGYHDAQIQLAKLSAAALATRHGEMTGFVGSTLVHTNAGLRPIEEIRHGDLVLTYPDSSSIPKRDRAPYRLADEYLYQPVIEAFSFEEQVISHVLTLGSTRDNDETLRVTPNQAIWSQNHGWVFASELKFGHTLVNENFSNTLTRKARHDVERVRVHNITFADHHTYFVGNVGIWVHS